ncbi:uncharacterized protein LOC120187132 [Hibiscus syriacus]|uniref:uncharacterized protein LOC120187132 n=1 Tax=Hibiscus syriacus TaxID=106335 RepID=UPI0019245DB5|nr:uncharacterized protein LOC120187132 [Hibiscus syriacus]
MVDVYANGVLLDKMYNDAYDILERISNNDYQYPNMRNMFGRRNAATIDIDDLISMVSQISVLTDMVKKLQKPGGIYEGLDFMGPYPSSYGNFFILVVVDYVSKWVEVGALHSSNAKAMLRFIHKNIFTRFGTPTTFISDEVSQFIGKQVAQELHRYRVKHRIATTYHPQTNGQAEVSNREIKQVLENVVNPSRKYWSLHLEEALWAYMIAYKTSLCMSPYRLVYGKACHLPGELELQSIWALKQLNFDLDVAGEK